MAVHVIWHPTSLNHDTGPGHPESPARIRAILDELHELDASCDLVWREAGAARREDVVAVHTEEYLQHLEQVDAAGGGRLDADTVMSPGSLDAALYAAGAATDVARLALDGQPAFAPVRPPGHHATANTAMGFCLLNNVVVAARTVMRERGLSRVLIVDWDVHHGNGTQDLVGADAGIRYVSLHQWPLYPGTGRAEERGVGNVFNVPRPPGLSPGQYVDDLNDAVHRATDGWTPELFLISAGYDAMAGDPLAGFTLEPEDYGGWITGWRAMGVPIGAVLEGGYAPDRIRMAARATVEALA